LELNRHGLSLWDFAKIVIRFDPLKGGESAGNDYRSDEKGNDGKEQVFGFHSTFGFG